MVGVQCAERKLVLNKEAVKTLIPQQLESIVGGGGGSTPMLLPGPDVSTYWTWSCLSDSGGPSAILCDTPYVAGD